MPKLPKQVEYERSVMKIQAFNRMKSKYQMIKERKTVEVDDYYDRKLSRAWSRYEKKYDMRTKKLLLNAEILEKKTEKKTDKAMIKSQQKKLDDAIQKRASKLQKIAVKEKAMKKVNHKENAHILVQLYARISRADKDWYVRLIDNNNVVKYTACDWWHLYPKQNYPQLVFHMDNIRPQSKWSNKRQWDNYWKEREKNVIDNIWLQAFWDMVAIAENKWLKNMIRDDSYYINQIKKYLPKTKQEFDKRGIEYPATLKKFIKLYENKC